MDNNDNSNNDDDDIRSFFEEFDLLCFTSSATKKQFFRPAVPLLIMTGTVCGRGFFFIFHRHFGSVVGDS